MDCGNPLQNLTNQHAHYEMFSPPSSTLYSSSATIVCDVTYFFADGTDINTITCSETGEWTPLPLCVCIKLNLLTRKFGLNFEINFITNIY